MDVFKSCPDGWDVHLDGKLLVLRLTVKLSAPKAPGYCEWTESIELGSRAREGGQSLAPWSPIGHSVGEGQTHPEIK